MGWCRGRGRAGCETTNKNRAEAGTFRASIIRGEKRRRGLATAVHHQSPAAQTAFPSIVSSDAPRLVALRLSCGNIGHIFARCQHFNTACFIRQNAQILHMIALSLLCQPAKSPPDPRCRAWSWPPSAALPAAQTASARGLRSHWPLRSAGGQCRRSRCFVKTLAGRWLRCEGSTAGERADRSCIEISFRAKESAAEQSSLRDVRAGEALRAFIAFPFRPARRLVDEISSKRTAVFVSPCVTNKVWIVFEDSFKKIATLLWTRETADA